MAACVVQVLVQASGPCGMRSVCVYGGVPKKEQVDALKRGVDIVVGTPGRLEDLMQEGVCKLSVSVDTHTHKHTYAHTRARRHTGA